MLEAVALGSSLSGTRLDVVWPLRTTARTMRAEGKRNGQRCLACPNLDVASFNNASITCAVRDVLALLPAMLSESVQCGLPLDTMGKRKKSSRKPAPSRQKVPLGMSFLLYVELLLTGLKTPTLLVSFATMITR